VAGSGCSGPPALADVTHALGATGRAREILDWVEAQATADGELPEQVSRDLRHPELLEPWMWRWEPPAVPLVW
jgi:GH15 family glucan-1,4-alpha-glucosidase